MSSSEDRDPSPRRRRRSPDSSDSDEPAPKARRRHDSPDRAERRPRSPDSSNSDEPAPKARRRHDSPDRAERRHQGHGSADHDDDHRIQQQDEQAAGLQRSREQQRQHSPEAGGAAAAADRDGRDDNDDRQQQRERRRGRESPDGRGGQGRDRGGRDRDREQPDVGRDSRADREGRPDRTERDRNAWNGRANGGGGTGGGGSGGGGGKGGSRRERWGFNEYQREEGGAGSEPVRKGRGFASGGGGGRRNSRSRSRDRDRGRGRYDSERDRGDRGGRDYRERDRDRDYRDRDRGRDYSDRDFDRRGSSGRDRDRDRGGRDDEDRGGRSERNDREREQQQQQQHDVDDRKDRSAAAVVAGGGEGPAAAAADGGGGGGSAAAANGAAAAGGDEKEAADFLKKKAAASGRTGGAYIPPFRLARMMAEIDDKNSAAAQKLSWEALRKSLNGLINKVNAPNMKDILPELFQENLMRGRGLFCQAIMKAQLASPVFSSLYAALVSVVNTKFPELGELLLHRVIAQFKRAYKRNDKPICIAAAKFLAHLINQGVLHEVVALEILILLLENPSDDSVEMAVDFCKEVGAHLQDVAPAGLHSVFERLRAILHEGAIDRRCQYMIEGLFAVRKAGFAASGHPAVKPELDLVEDDDQITHEMSLDDKHDPQAILNVFKEDPEYEAHEQQYKAIVKEILGDDEEEEGGAGDGEGSEGSEGSEDEDDEEGGGGGDGGDGGIDDATETNLVNLRRTIYLTIMSSLDFEEAGHKLMKIQLAPGQEGEIPIMIIECCSQEKTFVRYYALLGARFCHLRREFQAVFEDCFAKQYSIIHRLETNKLRNVAKLFAHLLAHDAISWGVLGCIRLTEDDTTSSSRIFIKYLFQELSEYMGLVKLNERLAVPALQEYFGGIFPTDTMANMRFSINFFTSIGLGGITDRQRDLYKQMPRIMAERRAAEEAAHKALGGGSGSGTSSSGTSSSGTSSSSSGSSSSSSGGSSSTSSSSSSGSDTSSDSADSRDRRRRRR